VARPARGGYIPVPTFRSEGQPVRPSPHELLGWTSLFRALARTAEAAVAIGSFLLAEG
jgi:hypothetical protein